MSLSLYILSSFIIGGIFIATTTIIIDKYSARLGGFLTGIPSTVVIAFIFITLSEGKQQAFDVTETIPATFSVNVLFLSIFYFLKTSTNHIIKICLLAISGWLSVQYLFLVFGLSGYLLSLTIWVVSFVIAIFFSLSIRNKTTYQANRVLPNSLSMAKNVPLRMILGGSVVTISLVLSHYGGAIYGSIASSFPAVYLSSIIITYLYSPENYRITLEKMLPGMMISGMLNVIVFSVVFRILILNFSIFATTAIALTCSLISAQLSYKLLKSKHY